MSEKYINDKRNIVLGFFISIVLLIMMLISTSDNIVNEDSRILLFFSGLVLNIFYLFTIERIY